MWKNSYQDYKNDNDWMLEKVYLPKSITGCEMHEINGWGESHTLEKKREKGFIKKIIQRIKNEFQRK